MVFSKFNNSIIWVQQDFSKFRLFSWIWLTTIILICFLPPRNFKSVFLEAVFFDTIPTISQLLPVSFTWIFCRIFSSLYNSYQYELRSFQIPIVYYIQEYKKKMFLKKMYIVRSPHECDIILDHFSVGWVIVNSQKSKMRILSYL